MFCELATPFERKLIVVLPVLPVIIFPALETICFCFLFFCGYPDGRVIMMCYLPMFTTIRQSGASGALVQVVHTYFFMHHFPTGA